MESHTDHSKNFTIYCTGQYKILTKIGYELLRLHYCTPISTVLTVEIFTRTQVCMYQPGENINYNIYSLFTISTTWGQICVYSLIKFTLNTIMIKMLDNALEIHAKALQTLYIKNYTDII